MDQGQLIILVTVIPPLVLGYFLLFLKNNRLNNLLTGLIFVSFFVFATNYNHFGFGFDIYRYLHRTIGILIVIALFLHIFRYRINVFKEPVPRILVLFFLVLVLSFLGNDIYAPYYVHYVRNYIFIALIALYLYYMLDSNEKLNELFKLIVDITIILSLFIVFEEIRRIWSHPGGLNDLFIHKVFLFSNPNYLAYSLFPGFVLTLFSKQKYSLLISLLILFSIIIVGSRAILLSTVFVLGLDIYFKHYKKIYLIPILLTSVLIITLFFDKIITNTSYGGTRLVLAHISMNIFKESTVNGIGYGQFRKKWRDYVDFDIINMKSDEINNALKGYEGDFPTAVRLSSMRFDQLKDEGIYQNTEKMTHNDVLTIVTELGLLGIASVVFLFYKLYIELQKLLLHNRDYFFLSIGLIGGSLLFSLFHNNLTSFVFWFVLFIPFIMNRNYNRIT